MQTKIEGLILFKIPHRENDLIATLLLRSGHQVSVLFYHGRSGGKKARSSTLEIGLMLHVELQNQRHKNEGNLYIAREWQLLWHYNHLRYNPKAYYLAAFYCQISRHLSLPQDLHQEWTGPDQEALFRILSNALYYLEEDLKDKKWTETAHLSLFLAKLLHEMGISPLLNNCIFCELSFENAHRKPTELITHEGGFACSHCSTGPQREVVYELWSLLRWAKVVPYSRVFEIEALQLKTITLLWDYFCIRGHLSGQQANMFKEFIIL